MKATARTVFNLMWLLFPLLTGCASIYDAVKSGSVAEVKQYLIKGGDVNARDEHSRTLLMLAALNSQPDLVVLLADKGADVNATDGSRTPLMYALLGNPLDKQTVTVIKGQMTTTYSWARRDLDTIRALIDKGADVNARDTGPNGGGMTPLIQELSQRSALGDNKVDRVKLLIDMGADVNAADSRGETPLLHVLNNFDVEYYTLTLVQYLVDKGAAVNDRDSAGKTPLMHAITMRWREPRLSSQTLEVVKFLVANGADVNARDNRNQTPLMSADDRDSGSKAVAAFLRENGAN